MLLLMVRFILQNLSTCPSQYHFDSKENTSIFKRVEESSIDYRLFDEINFDQTYSYLYLIGNIQVCQIVTPQNREKRGRDKKFVRFYAKTLWLKEEF